MPTVPTAPGPFAITSYTNVRVAGKARANSTGGATILQWQLGWGKSPNTPEFVGDLNADGSGFVSGLTPGVNYYFWNRQRNAYGWSDLSSRTMVRTRDVPDAPHIGLVTKDQTSFKVIVAPTWNGDSPITSYTLWYGNSPNVVGTPITHTSASFTVLGLTPGYNYYLWARANNVYGNGALSARLAVLLVAGARVNVGGVWKRAVPYVRVNGTWTLARSWVKQNGVWVQLPD